MQQQIKTIARRLHPARLSELADYLLKDEAISGKLILGATILALVATNTIFRNQYNDFWHAHLSIRLGDWTLSKDLRDWVSEGLMAIFFLVVGLELKRELVNGELRRFKTAVLPIGAALGGMLIPALMYIAVNRTSYGSHGWAIPMATDIAFAVAILAFVGKGIPSSIRLFLLTLAIVDDIGAVIVIAVFYNTGLNIPALGLAACVVIAILGLRQLGRLNMPTFVIASVLLWLAIDLSGVHGSIAGAIIGLLAPLTASQPHKKSIAETMERNMIPFSTLVVVPLFAFANTGIVLSLSGLQNAGAAQVAAGIILGLVVGKLLGIVGASWLMVRFNIAELPKGASWNHLIGVGLLAGIGFTVSIFVTDLAFMQDEIINTAKLSIFVASVMSGAFGIAALKHVRKSKLDRKTH